MKLQEILKAKDIKKTLRGALLEASRNFAPGSLADLTFNFYKALKQYYTDLLVYQFQLYSDMPHYVLGVTSINVTMGKETKFFLFSKGKNKNLSNLQILNEFPFDAGTEFIYTFELAPELTNLVVQTQNNINKELFTKTREISVAKGDGTFITGNFTPIWDNEKLTLKCTGIKHDTTMPVKIFKTY